MKLTLKLFFATVLLLLHSAVCGAIAGTPTASQLAALDSGSFYARTLQAAVTVSQSAQESPVAGGVREVRLLSHRPLGNLRYERQLGPDAASGALKIESESLMMADYLIVALRHGVDEKKFQDFLASHKLTATPIEMIATDVREYRVNLPSNSDADFTATLATLQAARADLLDFACPDLIYLPTDAPNFTPAGAPTTTPPPPWYPITSASNDPLYAQGSEYNLDRDNAPAAWSVTNDASGIVVAVVDTGILATHQDLAANMWQNPYQDPNKPYDGPNGANFFNNNRNTTDLPDGQGGGHGTNVAGIAGAQGNNGTGVSGTSWRVQLMAVKYGSETGGSSTNVVSSIDYARSKGASIVNLSLGGNGAQYRDDNQDAAIIRAKNAGILVVCAAGNDSKNTDSASNTEYPAGFREANQIVVMSTNRNDAVSGFSNFGANTVDLAAPGGDSPGTGDYFLSTSSSGNDQYAAYVGTSQATPNVTGALALMKTRFPGDRAFRDPNNPSAPNLRDRLLQSVDPLSNLSGICVTGGRLNMLRALSVWSKYVSTGTAQNPGWRYVPWFDYLNDQTFPWCNHLTLGFLYVDPASGSGTDNLYLYSDYFHQFFYTNESLGQDPNGIYLYRFSDSAWLYYVKGSNNPKSFFNYNTNQWEYYY